LYWRTSVSTPLLRLRIAHHESSWTSFVEPPSLEALRFLERHHPLHNNIAEMLENGRTNRHNDR
jgi:hypothetical protein